MEAYRVIISYLATGTITQLCSYMLVQPSLCRCYCDVDRCSYMCKCVILLFMGCTTWHNILFIFGTTPICVDSYSEYYNVQCIYITLYRMMQIEINWLIDYEISHAMTLLMDWWWAWVALARIKLVRGNVYGLSCSTHAYVDPRCP